MQQSIGQGAVWIARAWVHHQMGGLVDHKRCLIGIEHIQFNGLGLQCLAVRAQRGVESNVVPHSHRLTGLDHPSVEHNIP